jgi:hypothetical protein
MVSSGAGQSRFGFRLKPTDIKNRLNRPSSFDSVALRPAPKKKD